MDTNDRILHARDRILQAAAHVYAEFGFRGATTRRIAAEAGVNEVTLFRIFGSKSALLDEVLQAGASQIPVTLLPDEPVEPLRELSRWCAAHLEHLRARRSLTKKVMSELEERPEMASCAGAGPTCAAQELRGYLARLRRAGLMPAGVDVTAAVAMLLGTLFSDAMGRDVWPTVFPQPAAAAPRLYARLFLRAVGVEEARREPEALHHARVKLRPTVAVRAATDEKDGRRRSKDGRKSKEQQAMQPEQSGRSAAGQRADGRR